MVDSPYFELFQKDSVDKQLKIEFDGGVITNEELHNQQFELTESLCSESELRFGSCEASMIKFKISNIFIPLKDKWLTVSITLDGNTKERFLIGKYKVYSDAPTADKKFREITAYDLMYDIINLDAKDWYNFILPEDDSTVSMKQFRTSFIRYFGFHQEDVELINDDMLVKKTINPDTISGKDVITAICEINGCFGHIGRDGKIKYIYLPQMIQGLYPANNLYPDHAPDYLPYQQETGHLYPQSPKSTKTGKGFYISCSYEDFITKEIKKLQIRKEENDIGIIVGSDGNCYIIEDNFLVYGKSAAELEIVANNILEKIKGIIYRPFEADCKGNPCFEIGDPVSLSTKYELVESYILQRTLKGIQALRDNYSAEGVLQYEEKVNSVQKSIVQLKGKTNALTRNAEETRLEMRDMEKGLLNDIKITAEGLQAEVARAEEAEGRLSSGLKINAENIAAEVKRAQGQEVELAAAASVQAEQIKLKVSKGDVSSEISQESEKIRISANRLVIDSTQFKLDENGNAVLKGNVEGGAFIVRGKVYKKASDYNENDLKNVEELMADYNNISVEDIERYDLNNDGVIDLPDIVRLKKLINNDVEYYEYDCNLTISPTGVLNILKTDGCFIGNNALGGKQVYAMNAVYAPNYYTLADTAGTKSYQQGVSGEFKTSDNKTVRVSNGLITYIY